MSSIFKYDYREEAKTNEWQRKSGYIKQRDNYTCQFCGKTNEFTHVHHRFYDSQRHYWDYPDESLITLCEKCHEQETSMSKNINMAKDAISRSIEKARNSGIMSIEIIKEINSLIDKSGLDTGVCEKKQKYNLQTEINKKQSSYTVLQTIHDRKKTFLKELSSYGLKYEPDYLQNFAEYWTVVEKNKLRFEHDSNFLMPSYLANWKEKSLNIEKEKKFRRIINEAENYAREQLEGYKGVVEPIIASEIEEVEENEHLVKSQMLEIFYSKAEDIKRTKVQEVIPSYKNPNTTVYSYIKRVSRPGAFAEIYKIDPKTNSEYTVLDNSYVNDFHVIKSYIGPRTKINPNPETIDAIEIFFGINLWLPIPFKKRINYIMNSNFYIKRQICKYMLNFPEHKERFLNKEYYWQPKNFISVNDFTMLYEANQAFLKNSRYNLKRLNDLEDISLVEFCNMANVTLENIDKEITLKAFLKKQNEYFDLISLCSVQIEFARTQFSLEITLGFSDWKAHLAIILEKMNELYGFTFVVHLNQISTEIQVPLEILALTNGYMFDFDTESFYNGTMSSIQLPEELQSIDYYYDQIKMLIDDKKKAFAAKRVNYNGVIKD